MTSRQAEAPYRMAPTSRPDTGLFYAHREFVKKILLQFLFYFGNDHLRWMSYTLSDR
jgi:hypothetical protein